MGVRQLSEEIVCEIFHRYFTMGQTLRETGDAVGLSQSSVQAFLAPAREAFGIVKRMRFGQPEPVVGYYASGDDRFQAAMIREMKAGRERVTLGTVTDDTPFTTARFSSASSVSPSCPQGWDSTTR